MHNQYQLFIVHTYVKAECINSSAFKVNIQFPSQKKVDGVIKGSINVDKMILNDTG